jgi:hypothetical protein
MINLEQDFIKFETNGNLAYYGYTRNLNASDSDNNWSIRLLTGTGSTFDVKWSNNDKLNFISKWSEKEDYFQFDESDSFGLSYSLLNVGSYNFRWFEKLTATEGRTQSEFNAIFDREPELEGVTSNTDINWNSDASPSNQPEYLPESDFAWEVTTFLRIDVSGNYEFNTISDDGNQLEINGEIVTSYYGGRGANAGDFSEPIFLTKGYHTLRYRMEQGGGGAAATVKWKTPGSNEFVVIPSRFFNTDDSNFEADSKVKFSTLDVEWNDLAGYDIYNVSIFNERGKLVNKNNIEIYNKWSEISTETILGMGTDKLTFRFFKPVGLTYTFKIESSNIGGKLTESFTF